MWLIKIFNLHQQNFLYPTNPCLSYPYTSLQPIGKPSLIVYLRCLRLVEEFWSSPKPMVIYLLWQVVRDIFHFHLWDIYIYDTWEMRVSKHYLWGASIWPPCLSLVFCGTIICCNYFYITVKWPLTCLLIRIKAHLLEDKQISSVRVYDEAKNEPLLGGHLSPELNVSYQILP